MYKKISLILLAVGAIITSPVVKSADSSQSPQTTSSLVRKVFFVGMAAGLYYYYSTSGPHSTAEKTYLSLDDLQKEKDEFCNRKFPILHNKLKDVKMNPDLCSVPCPFTHNPSECISYCRHCKSYF